MDTTAPLEPIVEAFIAELLREDDMGAVIRTHIRLENLLAQFIDVSAPRVTHVKRLNLDFDGRVTLALLLGLDEDIGYALRALGTLRNRFAHNLETQLDAQAVQSIYSCLPSRTKDGLGVVFEAIAKQDEGFRAKRKFSNLSPKEQFKHIAVSIWVVVEADLDDAKRTKGA